MKSFILERSKAFACDKEMEKIGVDFYFANPYSAWQRGARKILMDDGVNSIQRE